jgi:hypothetical protein
MRQKKDPPQYQHLCKRFLLRGAILKLLISPKIKLA